MQRVALEHGLILVDTKYEFGKSSDGSILLIDEVRFHFPERFPASACHSFTLLQAHFRYEKFTLTYGQ